MGETIRVLICDDHAVVRYGLRSLLSSVPEIELVGEAADGEEAVQLAKTLRPHVVILDLKMPRKDGITAIVEIMAENPQARILVLTSFANAERVLPAIKAGALGYLLKDSSGDELVQAIKDVFRKEISLHPSIARQVIDEFNRSQGQGLVQDNNLTERELEVLALVAKGLSNQSISERLGIREGTVRIHVGNILSKLQLTNRTQAALYALRQGLARLETN